MVNKYNWFILVQLLGKLGRGFSFFFYFFYQGSVFTADYVETVVDDQIWRTDIDIFLCTVDDVQVNVLTEDFPVQRRITVWLHETVILKCLWMIFVRHMEFMLHRLCRVIDHTPHMQEHHPHIPDSLALEHDCGILPVTEAFFLVDIFVREVDSPGKSCLTVDHADLAVMGDGELAEGSVWEGAMAASQYKLDNLCAVVDRNRLQISGNTEDVMHQDDLHERFRSFGWNVIDVKDGNNIDQLNAAFEEAKTVKGKPTVLIANTIKGCGSSVMEDKAAWHHHVPNAEEYDQIMKDLEARKEAALNE